MPVAPTETTLAAFTRDQLRTARKIVVQVYNPTAQTFTGTVYRKKQGMTVFAVLPVPELASIAPGASEMADIDVEGTDQLEVRGYLSGLGGDMQIGANRKASAP